MNELLIIVDGIQYSGMSRCRLDRPSLMVPHDNDILVGLSLLSFCVCRDKRLALLYPVAYSSLM